MKRLRPFLNLVAFIPAAAITSFSGAQIQVKTGISGWELAPFTFGIVFMAWSPLISILLDLRSFRTRLEALERSREVGNRA
jgi:hypothetical protein